ncbi:MAG: isochorismate synthase [Deltaproteobacteria bacterium]|nr:isochorismate synthase [Deltaproteobacteria bacterium]RLB82416.1 MAG: isochorismate synthase [Deltaproteobacteria bacterium]
MTAIFQQGTVGDIGLAIKVMAEKIKEVARSHDLALQSKTGEIVRLQFEIPDVPLLTWLAAQRDSCKVYWSDREKEFEMAGVGVADLVMGNTWFDHDLLFSQVRSQISNNGKDVRYYGGLRFSHESVSRDDHPWKAFGCCRFVLPRFELYRHLDVTHFACNLIPRKDRDNLKAILDQLDAVTFFSRSTDQLMPSIKRRHDTPDQEGWKVMFNTAMQAIDQGELEKIVLARRTTFEFSEDLKPILLLERLKTQSEGCVHFCVQVDSTTAFIGASPERLYQRQGRTIKSEAVAGTRPRGETYEADERLGQELLSSEKDVTEHAYVVKSVDKILSRLCRSHVNNGGNPAASLLKLTRVQHLISSFEGELADGITDSEVLRSLHPTPSVGGYPAPQAITMIGKLEPFDRGWYAGPIGWIGFDDAEFMVGIRSGLIDGRTLHLFSGAGILNASTPQREWEEIENKLSNFIEALC